ncbi:MAG: glycosyltransferase [Conexivisphaerales archaeon]
MEVRRLLESLSKINLGQLNEIIAVDNSSSQTVEINMYKNFGNVKLRLVRNKSKMPLPYNRNQIFRMSLSDIVIFVDSDTEFIQNDFIDAVLSNFSNFNVDVMAPIIFDPSGKIQSFGLKKILGLPYIFRFNVTGGKMEKIDMIHGACFAVRKSVYDTIGGFDEFMNPYNFDEMDFCIRAGMARFKIYAFDNIRIKHYGGATTSRFGPDQRAYLFVSHALRSIRRNYKGLRKVIVATVFITAAYIRTLMDFRQYFFRFVITKAIVHQLNDADAKLIYNPEYRSDTL